MKAKTLDEKEEMIKNISEIIRNADFIDINFTLETLKTAPIENWRSYVVGEITVSVSVD